jgi:hypothetical protein
VNSSMILLLALLLIIVSVFTLVMIRHFSRIEDELRQITATLSEMPKEISIRDYMYAQDNRLCDIREKLDTYSGSDVLQHFIQDQANQIIAVITTQEESRKSGITKVDLEVSLQMTNRLLEKVLWSLRFDEEKYVKDATTNKDRAGHEGTNNFNTDTKSTKPSKDKDDDISMKSILDESNDSYGAMLKYMQKFGKSGTDALQALKSAKQIGNR